MTSSYKYSEIWLKRKQNLDKHLEEIEIEKKVLSMINEIKRLSELA